MPVHPDAIDMQNQILAGHFGPNRSSVAPDSYVVRLWKNNPLSDSPSEADWGGYPAAGVEWNSDDWLTPEGGAVSSDGMPDFGVPSTAGSDAARYWGLHDTVTDVCKYSAPLDGRVSVTGEEEDPDPIKIRLTVPYGGRN